MAQAALSHRFVSPSRVEAISAQVIDLSSRRQAGALGDLLALTVERTGIEASLAKAGLRYYELSFQWKLEVGGEVEFFLNPLEHRLYNCGWYSLADLQAWAWGEGPIVRKAP